MIDVTQEEYARLLKLAHEAPLNPYRLDADGHRWVEQQSYAWARAGRDVLNASLAAPTSVGAA